MEDWKERAKQLAEEHWKYHVILVPVFNPGMQEEKQSALGDWYKAIAFHFYKHAIEDIESGFFEKKRS